MVTVVGIADQAVESVGIRQAVHLDFDLQVDPGAENTILTTNQQAAVRALTLLLDNAMTFTKQPEGFKSDNEGKKEQAVLKVSQNDTQVVFAVEDSGIGVPAEEAEHIFEEFVQLNEYYEGTGIGLTVARSLARRLGGDIILDTTYTAGARFVMNLPIK
jgi:signal transduction histidine kinase